MCQFLAVPCFCFFDSIICKESATGGLDMRLIALNKRPADQFQIWGLNELINQRLELKIEHEVPVYKFMGDWKMLHEICRNAESLNWLFWFDQPFGNDFFRFIERYPKLRTIVGRADFVVNQIMQFTMISGHDVTDKKIFLGSETNRLHVPISNIVAVCVDDRKHWLKINLIGVTGAVRVRACLREVLTQTDELVKVSRGAAVNPCRVICADASTCILTLINGGEIICSKNGFRNFTNVWDKN
jgi:hypothetical protein